MEISLVLSGGAARGAFHLGVVARLEELGINIKAISGSSIGSIIAVSLASGLKAKEIYEIISSKDFKKIVKLNLFKSFFKLDLEHNAVKKLLPIQRLENLNIPVFITAVDLRSGRVLHFSQGEVFSLCQGSSALMPLFEPKPYESFLLADGGYMNNLPVKPLLSLGFPTLAIDLHPVNFKEKPKSYFKRALFLMTVSSNTAQKTMCDFYLTNPELEKFKLFSFNQIEDCYKLGYNSVNENLFIS